MKIFLPFLMILILQTTSSSAQLTLDWEKIYGDTIPGNQGGIQTSRDSNGNIIVGGITSNNGYDDILTIKYDSSGNLIWQRNYIGAINFNDAFDKLIIDGFDNIYVTGVINQNSVYKGVLFKYDSAGTLLWETTYLFPSSSSTAFTGLAFGPSGNVYVSGRATLAQGSVTFVNRYDDSGNQLWTGSFTDPDRRQFPIKISSDESENIYVAGDNAIPPFQDRNIFLLKFDSTGSLLWDRTFADSSMSDDLFGDFITDHSGNVYMTGSTYIDSVHQQDAFIVKYDFSGSIMHLLISDDSTYINNYGGKLFLSVDTLLFFSQKNTDDPNTSGSANWGATDSLLNVLWEKTIDDTSSVTDEILDILKDSANDLYLQVRRVHSPNIFFDQYILKSSFSGNILWTSSISDTAFTHDAYSMVLAGIDNVFLTGAIFTGNFYNCYTSHYNSNTTVAIPKIFVSNSPVIYPVPAIDICQVILPSNLSSTNLTFRIYDCTGRLVRNNESLSNLIMHVENLRNGFYLVEMSNDNQIWRIPFIIQK